MALNDAVPSSATDVFKRNAEDTDRLLNQTANVVNRVGTTLETFPSSTGRVSTAADAAQVAIQADVDAVESKKNSALIDIQIDVDAAEAAKVAALSSYAQWNSRGDWATATTYANGDIWNNTATSTWYLVLNDYTSGATVNDDINGANVTVLQGEKYGTFEGVSDAVAFITAHPELFPDNTSVSTSSYRTPAECTTLGINYPDGGGAEYVVVAAGTGTDDGGSFINAGSLQLKLIVSGSVNVKQFGAKSDGVTDDIGAIQAAITYVTGENKTIYFPSGKYLISTNLNMVGSLTIVGQGQYTTEIVKTSSSPNDKVLSKGDSEAVYDNLSLVGITLTGALQTSNFLEVGGGIISARNIKNVIIERCTVQDGRGFGINLNVCDNVSITDNTVQRVFRDGIGVWNTKNTKILDNIIMHNDDDGISMNRETYDTSDGLGNRNILIKGNTLIDSGGIRSQGGNKLIIANNTFERIKASQGAIFLSTQPASLVNYTNPSYIAVHDNIITDRLDRNLSVGEPLNQNLRVVIKVEGGQGIAGGLSAPPREIDLVTGAIITPYAHYYTASGLLNDQPIGTAEGIYVYDNQVKRTLPNVAAYSDWGFGEMFSRFSGTGWVNPAITDQAMSMVPVEIEGPIKRLYIERNYLAGSGNIGINFKPLTEVGAFSDFDLQDVYIKNNTILDNLTQGVSLVEYANSRQGITIKDNDFNCDPFFRSVGRQEASGFTGAWTNQTICVAINTQNVENTKILGNSFRNCSVSYLQGGVSNTITKVDNTIYAQPIDNGFNTSNKGVGTIPVDAQYECKVVYEGSDPRSITYSNVIEPTVYAVSGAVPPNSGFFMEGVFVTSRGINPIMKNGVEQAVHGFKRLTTGTGHVEGTDWQAVWFEV